MRGISPDGQLRVVEKRKRMRDQDLLEYRDILMLAERIQGRPDRDTAKMFGISRQLLQRRLNRLASEVRTKLARMLRDREEEGVALTDEQIHAIKVVMRKGRVPT